VAKLARVRGPGLVEQGTFRDLAAVEAWAQELETLAADPARRDIAWRLAIDRDVLDPALRRAEVRNWLEQLVRPRLR